MQIVFFNIMAINLTSKFMGLNIKSPIIAGSSGITSNIDNLCQLEDSGAGAVVLKSIFEEEIIYDIKRNTHIIAPVENYGDSYEYIAQHVAEDSLEKHFNLIRVAKERLSIPVIGSINCFSYENWITYARNFEQAGCDGIELNISFLPYEPSLSCDDVERLFDDIVRTIKKVTTLPVSIKVGPYFTDMAKFLQQLSWMSIQGITLFNKSLQVDIDTDKMELQNAGMLSTPEELYNTIRWTAILAKKMRCPISATTGVYSAEDVVKLLLAGAGTVQVASCLYKNGTSYIKQLTQGLLDWMDAHHFDNLDQFRGKLAIQNNAKASILFRTQFMRYFSDIK